MDPPASREISLTIQWLWRLSSWLSNSDSTVSMFSSVCALLLPLPGRLSSVPNFTSSLLLFFVQPLFRNFVINCRACNLYIHTDFWSKFCLLYWTASKLARLLSSKFALFSVSGLKDEKLIKMQTFMKTETCKLCSRVSWIFLPDIVKIYPYNFELNRFKVWSFFWDTVYMKYLLRSTV